MVFFLKFGWEFRDPLGEALTWHLVFYHLIQRGSVPFSISFYFLKMLPQNSNNQRRDKALKPSVNVYHVTNISPSNIILSFRFLHVHSKSQNGGNKSNFTAGNDILISDSKVLTKFLWSSHLQSGHLACG